MQGRLAGLDEERDRLIRLCTKGVITDGALSRHLSRLEVEAGDWKSELERMAGAAQQLERAKEIEASAYAIAERIRASVEELRVPRTDGSGVLRITASMGVSASTAGHKEALIADADAALYDAKRRGKNRTVSAANRTANDPGAGYA